MFPTAGSEIYRNNAGEVLGWDGPSSYDLDGPDPDDYYDLFGDCDDSEDDYDYGECGYCGTECDGDCEPVRCEADLPSYKDFLTGEMVSQVCQWSIPLNGECPNAGAHHD
jgi:hypothetical protein